MLFRLGLAPAQEVLILATGVALLADFAIDPRPVQEVLVTLENDRFGVVDELVGLVHLAKLLDFFFGGLQAKRQPAPVQHVVPILVGKNQIKKVLVLFVGDALAALGPGHRIGRGGLSEAQALLGLLHRQGGQGR